MEAETPDVENLMLAITTIQLSVRRLEKAMRRMNADAIDATAAAAKLVEEAKKMAKEE